MKAITLLISSFLILGLYGQKSTIKGEVYNEFLEPFFGAVIKSSNGRSTISKANGSFTMEVKIPTVLTISSEGFTTEKLDVNKEDQQINLILKRSKSLDRFVLSATRTPERIFESPSSISRISTDEIKSSPAFSFYQAIGNLSEVDLFSNGFGVTTVNTRGFSDLENARFVQLIDGVDNLHPTTGFTIGNVSGAVDSDVKRVEILPGAASALYGANAFNGVMLVKTKSPFDYQGITVELKSGVTTQKKAFLNSEKEETITKPFYNVNMRGAYKFHNNFAGKVAFSILEAEDWHADDYRNTAGIGGDILGKTNKKPTNFDGVNTYGDEYNINLKSLPYLNALAKYTPQNVALVSFVPNKTMSRTGYKESDLQDSRVYNLKFTSSLNYRPFGNDKLEVIWAYRYSSNKAPLQAPPNRYNVEGESLVHSLNFKGENYFLRGYYSNTDAGKNSYNTRLTGILLNQRFKPDRQWFQEAAGAYIKFKGQENIDEKVRKFIDKGRPISGTPKFRQEFEDIIKTPIKDGGSRYVDDTSLYHVDGNYDFSKHINFIDIQFGGSFRRNVLDSDGNLFTDKIDEKIFVDEYGLYSQVQKKFLNDRLKFTGAIRYDKSRNFKGNISPRASLVYILGENKNHAVRASYQTAFKNPKLLDQYMGLKINRNTFTVGNVEDNVERFQTDISVFNPNKNTFENKKIDGEFLYKYGFSKKSFKNYMEKISSLVGDNANFEQISKVIPLSVQELKTKKIQRNLQPEKNTTFEIGYRGMINIDDGTMLELDINSHYSYYTNLIEHTTNLIPLAGNPNASKANIGNDSAYLKGDPYAVAVFSLLSNNYASFDLPVNNKTPINAYGASLLVKTQLFYKFDVSLNYLWSDYSLEKDENEVNFSPAFNSPKHIVKIQIGSNNLFKRIGFGIGGRWQDQFYWSSDFASGIMDARTVIDAQISLKIPSLKSRIKVGGNNILGKEYYSSFGPGKIGSTYFLSWTIND